MQAKKTCMNSEHARSLYGREPLFIFFPGTVQRGPDELLHQVRRAGRHGARRGHAHEAEAQDDLREEAGGKGRGSLVSRFIKY